MKTKKAQAAIEFLTTYSWAIMIIFLTIGALTYFDIFNTNRFLSERCDTGAQISCMEATVSEAGDFQIRLVNNYQVPIEIKSVTVDTSTANIGTSLAVGGDGIFSVGGLGTFSRNSREMFDLTIVFSRVGGTRDYEITGNTVVRPVP